MPPYLKNSKSLILTAVVLLFLSGFCSKAQNHLKKTDSLKQVISSSRPDTAKVRLLISLGNSYMNNLQDSALHYYQQAIELAKKTKSEKHIAKCANSIGVYYYSTSNYKKALDYYHQALSHYEKIKFAMGISDSYNNIAIIYAIQGNYNNALEYFLKAVNVSNESGNNKESSRLLNNIGLIYRELGDNEKATEYFQKSLKIHLAEDNKIGIAACYNNIGLVQMSEGRYKMALEAYNNGLEIIGIDDKKSKSILTTNMGMALIKLGEYNKAVDFFNSALSIYKEIGEKHGIGVIYGNLADLYISQEMYDKAIGYAMKTVEISREIEALPLQLNAYEKLSTSYDSLGDHKNALKYHQLLKLINDSIFNENKSGQISEMQAKFETLEKEQENELLRKDNELKRLKIDKETGLRNFFIALFVLFLLLAAIIFYRLITKRKANLLLKGKNDLIEKQKGQLASTLDELKELNQELNIHKTQLEEKVKERTNELELKNEELERYNSLFIGREFRIKELRDQVKDLKQQIQNRIPSKD